MKIDFGLFEGNDLLVRGEIKVTPEKEVSEFGSFLLMEHQLKEEHASIMLKAFALDSNKQRGKQIIKAALHMPIHDSDDWESIELERYTLAFMSSQNA